MFADNNIYCGDSLEVLKTFPSNSVDCVVTSPPYWALRDYGVSGQLGLEPTFNEYIEKLCDIFDEVKRVLKDDGTCWVNMGDTYGTQGGQNRNTDKDYSHYNSIKLKNREIGSVLIKEKGLHKSLCQIPSRFAIEMCNRGWILRNEIIWHKPNCMPSSARDRFTVDFEKVFFFVKSKKYYFNQIKENLESICVRKKSSAFRQQDEDGESLITTVGRNKRAVWRVTTKPYKEAHFATYPEALVEPMIYAGCPEGGIVLDPFFGAGTTGIVAKKQNKRYVGIELNKSYCEIAEKRIKEFIVGDKK